jgi:hypothetical protein
VRIPFSPSVPPRHGNPYFLLHPCHFRLAQDSCPSFFSLLRGWKSCTGCCIFACALAIELRLRMCKDHCFVQLPMITLVPFLSHISAPLNGAWGARPQLGSALTNKGFFTFLCFCTTAAAAMSFLGVLLTGSNLLYFFAFVVLPVVNKVHRVLLDIFHFCSCSPKAFFLMKMSPHHHHSKLCINVYTLYT